jgi:hypothetical protein
MQHLRNYWGLALLATLAAGLSGCFSTDVGPSAAELHKSDSAAAAGTETLDDVFKQMSGSQFEYGNENLTELRTGNAAFQEALRLNPHNNEARFGAALTGVLLALQSQRLSDLFNRMADAESPLNLNLTGNYAPKRALLLRRLESEEAPEVHELQDAVADTLLPALETAIANLQAVYNDPAFSLTLTMDGKAKEIDHAEAGVLLAGFKTLHALATLVLAYDYDFDDNGSYHYLEVIDDIGEIDYSNLTAEQSAALTTLTNLLKMSSPFLAVRPDWKNRLANVDNEVNGALDVLKAGLSSIRAETDEQDDDILRLCSTGPGIHSDCIQRGAFDAGLRALDSLRKYMNQPYPVQVADTTVRVNFAAYFNVQDYKKMWPYYGFYAPTEWSDTKPVFYFATSAGAQTGNARTLDDLMDRADAGGWTNKRLVDSLKVLIKWRDPTFQGFLPGTTEPKLWALILKLADEGEGPLAKGGISPEGKRRFASSLWRPTFALSLLGKD